MNALSSSDKKILDDIKKYGWHVIKVLEGEDGPGFGYSIGLYKTFGHPEIIIIELKLDLIHNLINDIGEQIKNGKAFNTENFYSDLIEGFDCYFALVDKKFYEQYIGNALWFYNNEEFPLIQCIYPTVNGIYPWEKDWPDNIKNLQTLLGEVKIK